MCAHVCAGICGKWRPHVVCAHGVPAAANFTVSAFLACHKYCASPLPTKKKEVPPDAYGTSHGVHATITLCAPHKTQQREVNHHPAHPNVHPAQKLRCPMCLAAGGNFRKLSGHPLASHCTRSAVPQQLQLYYKLYEGLIRPAQRCHIHACNDVYHVCQQE